MGVTTAADGTVLPDALDVSDEDFAEMSMPDFEESPEGEEEVVTEVSEEADGDEEEAPTDEGEAEDGEDADADDQEGDSEGLEEGSEEDADEGDADASDDDKDAEVDSQEEVGDTSEKEVELLPESLRTIQANGKSLKIDSLEEALQLMQMGANYGKKMKGLAPNLRIMKMLDNNGLLSEDKINRLIDLDKKDPAAIAALLKESGLDALEPSTIEAGESYKPTNHKVGDQEVQLDAAFDAIEGTSSYQATLKVVSTDWDESSKQAIVNDPKIIGMINQHIGNGTFDQVQTQIDKQRMLGGLAGMSDIEAYQHVGNEMERKKQFAAPKAAAQSPAKKLLKKKAVDPKVLKDKKRAASATKSSPGSKKSRPFDPLSMTDDEIMAMGNKF